MPEGRRIERAAERDLRALENTLAPQAFLARLAEAQAAAATDPAEAALARGMARSASGRDLRGAAILQPFAAEPIGPDACLYRGAPAPRGRRLMVLLTGRLQRPMLPLPVFLQRVPAAEWDVLLLRDSRLTHYRAGCLGLAEGFAALAAAVAERARPYAGALAFGTSMGGLAAVRLALRCATAGRAMAAISVGGQPPDDFLRLFAEVPPPPAFDPLCACLAPAGPAGRPFVFVHAGGHERDGLIARSLAALSGGRALAVEGTAAHGVLAELWHDGRLDGFLAALLGARPAEAAVPPPSTRPGLLARLARPLVRALRAGKGA